MLTLRDHQSGDLFDPWEYLGPQRRRLLEQSWAGVFRDYLLQHLPVKELAACFRDDFGRPRKDLHVALGALILQQLHDLTDQQTTEAVALNIAWHYALNIPPRTGRLSLRAYPAKLPLQTIGTGEGRCPVSHAPHQLSANVGEDTSSVSPYGFR